MAVDLVGVVYECPSCGDRYVEQRCPDCNVFCRRLAPGGNCPCCDEVVLVDELVGRRERGLRSP